MTNDSPDQPGPGTNPNGPDSSSQQAPGNEAPIQDWNDAYSRYHQRLLAYIRQLAPVYGLRVDAWRGAEDVVQETFAAAHANWENITVDGRRGWLYAVARNQLLRSVAEEQRRSGYDPHDDAIVAKATWRSVATTNDEITIAYNLLVDAMNDLTPKQRGALFARHVLGFSSKEVAAMFNSTPATIRGRVHMAIALLRVRVEEPTGRGYLRLSWPPAHLTALLTRGRAITLMILATVLTATNVLLLVGTAATFRALHHIDTTGTLGIATIFFGLTYVAEWMSRLPRRRRTRR